MLIGNTDMHHGNLSFISSHGRPYQLAPAYDILPMGFAPKSGGGMVNTLRPALLVEAIDGEIWHDALELAENFFALANECRHFSANFAPCLTALRATLTRLGDGYRSNINVCLSKDASELPAKQLIIMFNLRG
jgi:hypothetical protein